MAGWLSSVSQTVNTGINTLTSSLNTDVGNGLNSSLRNANSIGSQLNSRINSLNSAISANNAAADSISRLNSSLASGNVSSQLRTLGADLNGAIGNNISSKVTQLNGDINSSLNKVSGALGVLSDLSSNPNKISQVLDSKLSSAGFTAFTNSGLNLGLSANSLFGDSFAETISAFNPIKTITRGLGDLAGAIGGEFSEATSYIESVKNDPWSFYANLSGGEFSNTVNQGGLIDNPLREYNSVNYIFTLGILDRSQYNNPDSYRNGGEFKYFVLKSGGGTRDSGYSTRTRTESELPNKDAEYFIDDVFINAIVAPNSNTGTSLGTNVEFTVTEPYSMGKFLEALLVASQKAGYNNYIDAPFCLKIEFCGWDANGERDLSSIKPFFIPIKLIKTDFNVGDQGSTYRIKAVPYNETALTDETNKTPVAINASGSTASEVLENSRTSVANVLNDRIEELENKSIIKGYDRYIIAFPKSKEGLLASIRSQNVDLSALRATINAGEQERIRQGNESVNPASDEDTINSAVPVISTTAPATYLYLKAYVSDINNMNEIGRSILLEDSRDGAPQPTPDAASVNNSETQTNQRQNNESQTANKSRSYQFSQGDNITNIIESIVQNTKYARDVATEPSQNGFKKWFRIEVLSFIDSDKELECLLGRPRRTYVYAVHPYTPHEASSLGPGDRPSNINNLKKLIKKEYNYIYTGKNEDVLDFDINFNNAFFNSLRPDMAQGRESVNQELASSGQQQGSEISPNKRNNCSTSDPTGPSELVNPKPSSSGGAPKSTATGTEQRIAQMFHERLLNNQVDMITANMDIWGDPYFIPTDLGNYSAKPTAAAITSDGAMNYMRNEVYVNVNFKTPLDYQEQSSLMDFSATVPGFSGLYKVLAVKSNFAGGMFKQTLKMVRMRGQTEPSTTNNVLPIVTASANKRLDSGGASANLPANPQEVSAAQAAARTATAPQTQVVSTSGAVTSGPDVVYTQELLTTGTIVNGVRTLTSTPVSNVADFIAKNPELRQFVVASSNDRTAIAVDPRKEIFPININNTLSSRLDTKGATPAGLNTRPQSSSRNQSTLPGGSLPSSTRPPTGPF